MLYMNMAFYCNKMLQLPLKQPGLEINNIRSSQLILFKELISYTRMSVIVHFDEKFKVTGLWAESRDYFSQLICCFCTEV